MLTADFHIFYFQYFHEILEFEGTNQKIGMHIEQPKIKNISFPENFAFSNIL